MAGAQEGATPPHWIWHRASGRRRRAFRRRRGTFARRSRSRSRRGWCWKRRPTTRSRFISTERRSPSGSDWHLTQNFETRLSIGRHVLAAVATNEAAGPCGLAGARAESCRWARACRSTATGAGGLRRPCRPATTGRSSASTTRDGRGRKTSEHSARGRGGPSGAGAIPPGDFAFLTAFKIEMAAAPSVTGSVVAFTFDESRRAVRFDRARADRPADRRRPRRPVRSPRGDRDAR